MNSLKQVAFVAVTTGALLLGSSRLSAQSVPTSDAGLIGRRYGGLDLSYESYRSKALDHTFGTAASLNLPVAPSLDLSFGYDFSNDNDPAYKLNHNGLRASLLTHQRSEYGNGYFFGTLGYNWNDVKISGVPTRDDDAIWALGAGYEFTVGARTALNAGVSYRDAFRGYRATMQFRLEASHWFSKTTAGVVSASYNHIRLAPDTLLYTLGLRWAF